MPPKKRVAWNKLPPEEKRRRNAVRCKARYYANKASVKAYWQSPRGRAVTSKHKALYYQKHKAQLLAKMKARAKANPASENARKNTWKRKRLAESPEFRLTVNMRERIRYAVLHAKTFRSKRTATLLGCSIAFLKGYLEAKFEIGMTWENYGQWHVDHIIPCAGFDLRNEDAQKECFHYSNLQPLWSTHNLSKGDIMPDGTRARNLKPFAQIGRH